MRFVGVFNRDGGTFRTLDLDILCRRAGEIFASKGHELDCRVVAGCDLMEELERAAADGEALLVGGGDGTASAAAGVALKYGIPIAILPAGTMNLFARSLHVPLDLDQALQALADGVVVRADIATANGRPFVHQFSVGIHARLVRMREQVPYHSRAGKMLASMRAACAAAMRPPNFWSEITTPEGVERSRASGIAISNNLLEGGHVPHADYLHRGVLGIYVLKPLSALALMHVCLGVMTGRWKSSPLISERMSQEASLVFPKKKHSAQAVIDGELVTLSDRVDFKMLSGALKVIVPRPAVEQDGHGQRGLEEPDAAKRES